MTRKQKTALFWILGVSVALGGASLTRFVAPHYEGTLRTTLTIAGQITALAGLIVIAFGVRQRVWDKQNAQNAAVESAPAPLPETDKSLAP